MRLGTTGAGAVVTATSAAFADIWSSFFCLGLRSSFPNLRDRNGSRQRRPSIDQCRLCNSFRMREIKVQRTMKANAAASKDRFRIYVEGRRHESLHALHQSQVPEMIRSSNRRAMLTVLNAHKHF